MTLRVVAGARLAGESVSLLIYWDLHSATTISRVYQRIIPRGVKIYSEQQSVKERKGKLRGQRSEWAN